MGVPDRYVDAFCRRVPKSVLARGYSDVSSEKLKEIYGKARIMVFVDGHAQALKLLAN